MPVLARSTQSFSQGCGLCRVLTTTVWAGWLGVDGTGQHIPHCQSHFPEGLDKVLQSCQGHFLEGLDEVPQSCQGHFPKGPNKGGGGGDLLKRPK